MKLFSAVVSQADEHAAGDESAADPQSGPTNGPGHAEGESCPHGWCPVCSTVDFVQDHPEVVAQVLSAGNDLLKAVRSVVETAAADRRGQS